ncbi:MAG: phosphatidylglycerol lysyltransferase domain-containing protein [Candidatus Margulisiibacteriota bacterium]|jgi:hypothetical protein
MQLPNYPNFKKLELPDLNIVKDYLLTYSKNTCEYALANLFSWRMIENTKITLINHNLCFLMSPEFDNSFFLEPVGNTKIPETIKTCLNTTTKVAHVSEQIIKLINPTEFLITPLPNYADYIYQQQDLAELKGRKFDGKRNHINKFNRIYQNYACYDFDETHFIEALQFFDIWYDGKEKKNDFSHPIFLNQKKILEEAFRLFDPLALFGKVIYIDQKFCGFILGSELNKKTVDVHFFYAHPEIKGIYQILLNEASKTIFDKYELINLEEDLGIPSLKQAKLSYLPLYLEQKYEIQKK